MTPQFHRALLLYDQARYELAEKELRLSLANEPEDAVAHAVMALCLTRRQAFTEAIDEAQKAIQLAPDQSFSYYTLAHVWDDRERDAEALEAVREAIRLDPDDPDYRALEGRIRFRQCQWREALKAAEAGLTSNPEHTGCVNLRAMALVKLGRKEEAGATLAATLAKYPENSLTHANQGWAYLHRGDSRKALEHFREALRLNPENEWARQGLVTALKARYFLYAWMLRYFLWMSRLTPRARWGVVVGGLLGVNAVRGVVQTNASWSFLEEVVVGLYLGFVIMTWIADPLFNCLLRFNRYGRYALSREQVVQANWVGGCLLSAVVSLVAWGVDPGQGAWGIAAGVFVGFTLPVSGVHRCPAGRPRRLMVLYASVVGALGLMSLCLLMVRVGAWGRSDFLWSAAILFWSLFLLGTVGSTWMSNILGNRPRRKA